MYNDSSSLMYYKGQYDTDLSNIQQNCLFPSPECRLRNIKYRNNMRLFTGEYAKDKKLVAMVNGQKKELNYRILPLSYFKLIINKLDSLLFSNEIKIRTGDIEKDKQVEELVNRTSWINSIRDAVRLCEIYGDCILKTYKNGVSVINPRFGYKVVNSRDKEQSNTYVLREILYNEQRTIDGSVNNRPDKIRILICGPGYEYERVYKYQGDNNVGRIGEPVREQFITSTGEKRWIPRRGRLYKTGFDVPTVQWLSVNVEDDGIYGTSAFENIKDIVFTLEKRLSMDNFVLDAHGLPILLISQQCMKYNEQTGEYYLSIVDDQFLMDRGDGTVKAGYLSWDGDLQNSKNVTDELRGYLYELTEMGEQFLSGKMPSQQISEETVNNLIRSAIDRGAREVNSLYKQLKASLYVLCQLNQIDVDMEQLNIIFNIGRIDDAKVLAEVCDILNTNKLFSRETLLCKFWDYDIQDARAEIARIQQEEELSNDNEGATSEVIRDG